MMVVILVVGDDAPAVVKYSMFLKDGNIGGSSVSGF